jgi:hypothetical protein
MKEGKEGRKARRKEGIRRKDGSTEGRKEGVDVKEG